MIDETLAQPTPSSTYIVRLLQSCECNFYSVLEVAVRIH